MPVKQLNIVFALFDSHQPVTYYRYRTTKPFLIFLRFLKFLLVNLRVDNDQNTKNEIKPKFTKTNYTAVSAVII